MCRYTGSCSNRSAPASLQDVWRAASTFLPSGPAAKELRVSIITVKKAWEELERSGLINSVVGKGCFVAQLSESELREKRKSILENQLHKDMTFYCKMGADREEIIDMISRAPCDSG